MNHDENPNDNALSRELRDALSEMTMPERPPLVAITSMGRAYQRRRLAAFAGLGVTGAAVGVALALGLTGALGAAPTRSTGTSAGSNPTPAFILTSNSNGTDTLTLTMNQILNPAALQQALTQAGIPALVKTGTYCSSSPAAPDPVSIGVLSIQPPPEPPHAPGPAPSGPAPGEMNQMVINPEAIPSGTELFFGESSSDHAVSTDLIYTNSYTCSSNP